MKNLLLTGNTRHCALRGTEGERFLTLCLQNAVPLSRVKKEEGYLLTFDVAAEDLPLAENFARRCSCELTGEEREKNPRRACAALLLLAAFLLMWASSFFIWDISVRGNQTLSELEIRSALKACGIREGSFWPGLVPEETRNKMMARLPELAWMAVNIRGSRAQVEIIERRAKPDIEGEKPCCDLAAARDGTVTYVSAEVGKPLIREGQSVREGEILLSGTVDLVTSELRTVRARGKVEAETERVISLVFPPETREKQFTGKLRRRFSLKIGERRIKLYFGGRKGLDGCDKITKEYSVGIKGLFRFPVSLVCESYRFYETGDKLTPSWDEAAERCALLLREQLDGEILSFHCEREENGLLFIAHCRENIAVEKEIDPNSALGSNEE